jgi:hypothetical protein
MNAQRAAEIQVLLEGVPLPAKRDMLVAYADREDAEAAALLRTIPDKEYNRLDAVGEALMHPPQPPQPAQSLPQPESGKPPGGSAYLGEAGEDADTGRVRHDAPRTNPPKKALEKQTSKQKRQKAVQEGEK